MCSPNHSRPPLSDSELYATLKSAYGRTCSCSCEVSRQWYNNRLRSHLADDIPPPTSTDECDYALKNLAMMQRIRAEIRPTIAIPSLSLRTTWDLEDSLDTYLTARWRALRLSFLSFT
jgi:hypothetical protein